MARERRLTLTSLAQYFRTSPHVYQCYFGYQQSLTANPTRSQRDIQRELQQHLNNESEVT